MKVWTYTIESHNSVNPEVLLFTSPEAMQARFVKDVLEDDRDTWDDTDPEGGEFSIADLRALVERGAPIEEQAGMAQSIYDDVQENGVRLPCYNWEVAELPIGTTPAEGEPELHLLMVLSTGHISKDAGRALLMGDEEPGPGVLVDTYEDGAGHHLILTSETDPDDEWLDPSLQAVVNYARERGATHLRLDRDGPVVAGLPTYNW